MLCCTIVLAGSHTRADDIDDRRTFRSRRGRPPVGRAPNRAAKPDSRSPVVARRPFEHYRIFLLLPGFVIATMTVAENDAVCFAPTIYVAGWLAIPRPRQWEIAARKKKPFPLQPSHVQSVTVRGCNLPTAPPLPAAESAHADSPDISETIKQIALV